jgi:two-component system phosphate regulon sensor histidine kinase PhoR
MNRSATTRERLGIAAVLLAVSACAVVLFAVAYLLTSALYERIGQRPDPLLTHIINTVLGLVLFFVFMTALGRIINARQHDARIGVFKPIIDALTRISQGDFKIDLGDSVLNRDDMGILGELAKSVTHAARELDQMEQMRQEFISNVSHEIQSPLTSIRGFANALQNERLSEKDRQHYLAIIETETTRLSRLTDNLLRLAALESDEVKFEPKPYRLDKQIRSVILMSEPQWTAKALDVEAVLDEITLSADEDLLSQVWINLLHNSIKFTPEGGKICVELHSQGEKVAFTITDTGIGISPEAQARIFERFYKADKSRIRSDSGGSGLGLSIARKIVTMHGGSIAVESTPEAGTRFTVLLPNK